MFSDHSLMFWKNAANTRHGGIRETERVAKGGAPLAVITKCG